MAEWELSKENVQPLKQGRKVSTLNSVLHAKDGDTQKLLQEQRSEFETEIRSYSGPDPLDPWYRYVSWVEQAFPKGGKEGKIHVLLEKCITKFKDSEEASEDPRFLEIWLKYAKMSSTPIEVYKYMYNAGICTQQAGLYDAWAWFLEAQGSVEAANSVYSKGLDALTDTEAKAGLQHRKQDFEKRVTRRLKGEEISQDEIYEQEQRCALGRLHGEGKHGKVGSVRVGGIVASSNPGVHRPAQPQLQVDRKALKPSNTGGFAIFSDTGSGSQAQPSAHGSSRSHHKKSVGQENNPIGAATASLPSRVDHKENVPDAGKWGAGGKSKKAINVPLNKIGELAPRPGFTLHQDEESEEDQRKSSTVTPHKLIRGESNVLTTKAPEKDVTIQVALFEPFDPTKKPMYCKNLVYQGTTEFSFEELRAIKWRARQKKKKEEEEIEQRRRELLERERQVREKEEALLKQMEEMKQMMLQQQQQQQQQQQVVAEAPQRIQPPGVRLIRPSTSSSTASNSFNSNQPSPLNTPGRSTSSGTSGGGSFSSFNRQYSQEDDTQNLLNINPSTGKMSNPSPHRNHAGSIGNCRPSPTVNTKAAMAVMQQLWANQTTGDNDDVFMPEAPKFEIFSNDPPQSASNSLTSSEVGQSVQTVQIYCDAPEERISIASAAKKPVPKATIDAAGGGFPIYNDSVESEPQKTAPFAIFSDENLEQPKKAAPFAISTYENSVEPPKAAPFTIFSDENADATAGSRPGSANYQEDLMEQENIPPSDYEPVSKVARPRFGVLQPVPGVPCMPLEDQEKMLDEDEDGFTKPMAPGLLRPGGAGGSNTNVTMFVPNETMFEKMAAKCASTPFRGGGYIPDDDENTCAIQLLDLNPNTNSNSDDIPIENQMLPPCPVSPVTPSGKAHGKEQEQEYRRTGSEGGAMLALSPIVEVSQECYRSSSSSSGADTSHQTSRAGGQQEFSKSHWGNTGLSSLHHTHRTLGSDSTAASGISLGIRTPGAPLGLTASSGYVGDKSSMYSHSTQKVSRFAQGGTANLQAEQVKEAIEDDEEDNTGMLGMLSEFKQALAVKKPANPSTNNPSLANNQSINQREMSSGVSSTPSFSSQLQRSKGLLERSYQPSLLGADERSYHPSLLAADESRVMLDASHHLAVKPTPTKLQFNGLDETTAAQTSISRPQLDLTGGINCSSLKTMPTHLSVTGGRISPNMAPSLDLTGMDNSIAQPRRINLELTRGEDQPQLEMTRGDHPQLELTRGDHPQLELTRGEHQQLELTRGDHSQLELTRGDHPQLELTRGDHPQLELTRGDHPQLELTRGDHIQLEMTTRNVSRLEMPSLDLTRPDPLQSSSISTTKQVLIDLPDGQPVDPFTTEFQELLLGQVQPPVHERHGYVQCQGPLPQVRENTMIEVGQDRFYIRSLKGEGGFAKVFSASREGDDMNCTIANIDAVLKVQKPANEWEWYICTEVQHRIKNSCYKLMSTSFMAIPRNYNFENGGIFVSYHQKLGTLLDVANKLKTSNYDGKELVAATMYFAIEILYLIEALHSVGVLHADIKPDNFLLQRIPELPKIVSRPEDVFRPGNLCLQLIDFGKAVDLTILPDHITFDKVVKTDGLYCAPMREKAPWREHIDYHGVAAAVYCVLFGQYLDIVKIKSGVWEEKGMYKRGWSHQGLFKDFFREFINIKSMDKASLPSMKKWRETFTEKFIYAMVYLHLPHL